MGRPAIAKWEDGHCAACGANLVARYERLKSQGVNVTPEMVHTTRGDLRVCPPCAKLDPKLVEAKAFARRVLGEKWVCKTCGYEGKEGPGHSSASGRGISPPLQGGCPNLATRVN